MLAAAATSKLQRAGLDWVLSENLRNILIAESLLRSVPLEELAHWTASEPWRWKAAAAGALFGEASLIFWFIVPWRRVRTLLILSGVGTMAGITLLMGLVGFPIVALGAVFASPGTLRDDLARGRSAWRVAAGPLTGFATLAAVVVFDKGWILAALPLLVGAAVYLWCLAKFVPMPTRRNRPRSRREGSSERGGDPWRSERRSPPRSRRTRFSPAGRLAG